ncbi:Ltp family lipoprotein [Pseudonocardia sulfidoxydans]
MELQAFSRDGLIAQLKYEGFTAAQAAHGAKSVGL